MGCYMIPLLWIPQDLLTFLSDVWLVDFARFFFKRLVVNTVMNKIYIDGVRYHFSRDRVTIIGQPRDLSKYRTLVNRTNEAPASNQVTTKISWTNMTNNFFPDFCDWSSPLFSIIHTPAFIQERFMCVCVCIRILTIHLYILVCIHSTNMYYTLYWHTKTLDRNQSASQYSYSNLH